jgi:hypothetical protein
MDIGIIVQVFHEDIFIHLNYWYCGINVPVVVVVIVTDMIISRRRFSIAFSIWSPFDTFIRCCCRCDAATAIGGGGCNRGGFSFWYLPFSILSLSFSTSRRRDRDQSSSSCWFKGMIYYLLLLLLLLFLNNGFTTITSLTSSFRSRIKKGTCCTCPA